MGSVRAFLSKVGRAVWRPIDRVVDWSGLRRTRSYHYLRGLAGRWTAGARGSAMRRAARRGRHDPGRPSILDGGGEVPIRPRISVSYAPTRPHIEVRDWAAPVATDPPTDSIRRLRRAAAIDIFEQTGLDIVPGQLWRFVDCSVEVDRAISYFLDLLGLDTEAIRRRDRRALVRANDLLEMLVQVDGAFGRLKPAAIAGIENAIFSGAYDRVRGAARIVSIYESIYRLAGRWPVEVHFAAFRTFLQDIADELDNPMSATLDDAQSAEEDARYLAGLMERFVHAREVNNFLLESLRAAGVWQSWPQAATIERDLLRFATLVEHVLAPDFDAGRGDAVMARLEALNAEVDAAIAANAAAGGRGRAREEKDDDASTATAGPPPPAGEAALIFFGFDPAAPKPTLVEAKKRYRRKCHETHPDLNPDLNDGGAAFREVQQHWDVLKTTLT